MAEIFETTIDKFIFRVAADRLYSPEGVWAAAEGTRVRLGLTDYMQQRNGDVAFVHVKPLDTVFTAGDEFAEIETVKANVSLFSPVGGKLVEVNPELELRPEAINDDPYGKGWLAVIEDTNWQSESKKLLDAKAYLAVMQSQAQEELSNQ